MVVFPAFFAVIFPLLLTVAIFLFAEEYVTFWTDVIGEITGFKVRFCFTFNLTLFGRPEIFAVFTAPFCTFTFTVAFLPQLKIKKNVAITVLF